MKEEEEILAATGREGERRVATQSSGGEMAGQCNLRFGGLG
jgi:hypothetical protein